MISKNNNLRVIYLLAQRSYRQHLKRNIYLIFAVSISIILLYCGLAISDSKLQTDYLIEARRAETIATVKIDQGSKSQVAQLKQLTYIKNTGVEKSISEVQYENLSVGQIVYQDQTTFRIFTLPAITNVSGNYPSKADEIMVSRRFLQQINKSSSSIGDQLALNLDNKTTMEFTISGMYTSYRDPSIGLDKIFIAKDYLSAQNIALYPVTNILVLQNEKFDGEFIEERLYKDLKMESERQQIIGQTTYYRQALDQTFGNYTVAILIGVLIFLSVYLFISNILSLSLDEDIQEIGLLKTIGTTQQQLNKIMIFQVLANGFIGTILGVSISSLLSATLIPKLVERLYLTGFGKFPPKAPIVSSFLLISICFSLLTLTFSMFQANRKVKKLAPKSAVSYITLSGDQTQIKSVPVRSVIIGLAWRNNLRSKKRFIITICSLSIGVLVGLSTLVIVNGTSIINKLKEQEDFGIVNLLSPDDLSYSQQMSEKLFIPQNTISEIQKLSGIDQSKTKSVQGNYVKINLEKEPALRPRFLANKQKDHNSNFATIQVLDEQAINLLLNYMRKIDYPADFQAFENGTGVLLLHHHRLSKALSEQAVKLIGEPISFFALGSKEFTQSNEIGRFTNAGYLDITKKDFPELTLGLNGTTINYMVISEKGFKSLGVPRQTMSLQLWGYPGQQHQLERKLTNIVLDANQKASANDPLFLASNEQLVQSETANYESTQFILLSFSLSLILIGFISFFNTLQMNNSIAAKETTRLRMLGMTSWQIQKLRLAEGFIYWLFFLIILLILIVPCLLGINLIMKNRVNYFHFEFPTTVFLSVIFIMLVICISTTVFSKK